MYALGRLRNQRLLGNRIGLTSYWNNSIVAPLASGRRPRWNKLVDHLVTKDSESLASAIVSLLRQSEVVEQCSALKEMRSNPQIESKAMGSLLKASDTHSNWFKQWVENVISGSYDKLFPVVIPLHGKRMVEEKAKLAANIFVIKSGNATQWIDGSEDQSTKDAEQISSEIADTLGNSVQLTRLTKLNEVLMKYTEGGYDSPAKFVNEIKASLDYYIDFCEPMLEFMDIALPTDWKVLTHLQREKRLSVIAELTNDINLLSSRNASRVSSEHPVKVTRPTPSLTKIRKFCLKPNGQVLRFDVRLKCYSLTSYKNRTQEYGFQSLLEKNRNLYDPNWQNKSDIMYRVNKEFTQPSSSLLDFLDGPEANLSTRKSLIDREAEMIEQKLKKLEEDQSVMNEVETNLVGNIPSFMMRTDREVFAHRVLIDNLPKDITEEAIHRALARCGGVSECRLYVESNRAPFPTIVPPDVMLTRAELEQIKREKEYEKRVQLYKEAEERLLAEVPDEYYKNGRLKPKKKIKLDLSKEPPKVADRIIMRKKVLEEEKNGNYAVLTMDGEESFNAVTRAAIKLFGICISNCLCKVTPVTEFKKFTVQIGNKMNVQEAHELVNEILNGEFECHIASPQVVDSTRPLYFTLEFDSHEEGWSAFEKLYAAYQEHNKPVYPSWVESPHYHLLRSKALAQKTFIPVEIPKGVVIDDGELREEGQTSVDNTDTSFSLHSYMQDPESGVTEHLQKVEKRRATKKLNYEKLKKSGGGKKTTDALHDSDAHTESTVSSIDSEGPQVSSMTAAGLN